MKTRRSAGRSNSPSPKSLLVLLMLSVPTVPIVGLGCLSQISIHGEPITALDITFLVIAILQLIISIIQFVFIVDQIFIWEADRPPPP
jgi:hypothetical protein